MASYLLISLLCFFSFFSCISSSPDNKPTAINVPLSQFNKNPSSDPWQKLNYLASSSLIRAHHIKNPKIDSVSKTPLSPRSYGGYSISLSFGTPPQTIPVVMDTGSDLVWIPCTHRYTCKNCSFPKQSAIDISTFIPKLSSSSEILGCKNPKCDWIHNSDIQSRCTDCDPNSKNCSQICPPYIILYGSGLTGGILLSETLDFSTKKFTEFIVGCSLFASHMPTGIAGFGRGPASLPSQLSLKKFSYCLLSHRFDDTKESSSLVLESGSDSGDGKSTGFSYTPFQKNPVAGNPAFSVYYYIGLRKIAVGEKNIKIPYRYLSPRSDGNGGTIIDSGTTFTFMEKDVFELVASEFENQMKQKRAAEVEASTGLRPCFHISANKTVSFPKLAFHFKGGLEMRLPLANYFSFIGNSDVMCLTVITNAVSDPESGPSIILGNYQQQNYCMDYDLGNGRLGFRVRS